MSIFGLGPLPKETTETPSAPALGDYGDLAARIQKQSEARRAYFDQLTEQLKARRYGPSASERLFAISAALAQPTRTPGFGGMLANVTPVFEQYAKDKRAAEAARASDMEKLGLARLNMDDDEIKTALELQQLRDRYAAQMAAANKRPRGTWSENLNQFVSEDQPAPTQTKVNVGGMLLTQYTDGNLYLRNADGSKDVYSPEGDKIGTIPAGGAR
jgi:hypothetical protein